MTIKKTIGMIHLWLGLASGLVVFVISITGCLYAFQDEIQNLTQSYRFVEARNQSFLPPSTLKAIAMKELPEKHLHAVMYGKKDQAAQVMFFHFEPSYYYSVYLNPYTGEVLKVKDMDADFFRIVLMGHFYLWLPPTIGQPVVASATLIFVVMLISGIVLWWPKNRNAAKQRFSIKWKAAWRRTNYDLHNVLGFYATWVLLILALTGLVWGFQWFAKSVHTLAGGEKSLIYQDPVSDKPQPLAILPAQAPAIDRVWQKMTAEHPTAEVMEVHIPDTDSSAIAASANPDGRTYWQTDYRFFDQYTLKELSVGHVYGRFGQANRADKLIRMNYDIHTGAILGLPGKILAFFASLIAASLPITGFLIWWGRRKHGRRKQNKTTQRVQKPTKPIRTVSSANI
ncbi:propeptide PepSY amd peptidase M4 [Fibrisoma limi BUZ 3]|uniref:Propeptide PepSY amd peptidase M4 n=1 Tax=Fibrisoma limi BUZ 3 TaxID=1185876 RepID=I2GN67_9BACT|nr:PepSY-associated TM helix domain-containing protein [Fibrisoma limi]CCH55345.1 propeptide PepSY amd peptidase M4 [Fibrisoma limi BUZ 3]